MANVRPACSFVWIWLMDGKTNSTGSSIVITLRGGSLTSAEGGVERRGLAAPRGPAHSKHPKRGLVTLPVSLMGICRHAEVAELVVRNGSCRESE